MKCGDIRCHKCGKDAVESNTWLERVDGQWQCAAKGCDADKKLTNEEKVLGAIMNNPNLRLAHQGCNNDRGNDPLIEEEENG